MNNMDQKTLKLSYSKILNNKETGKYGTIIRVDYSSKTELDSEKCLLLRNKLKDYLNVLCDNTINIIDIVKGIRDITNFLEETRLDVNIRRGDAGEYVYYKNALVESCGAYKEIWDDEIIVFSNCDGVDIRFKKEGFKLDSEDKINIINKELDGLYRTVITLNNMTKLSENEIKKGKTLTLKRK